MAKQHDLTDDVVQRKQVDELTTEGKRKVVAKFSLGFTVNLGNFESCKIEAGIELEGTEDNLKKLQEQAQEEVEGVISKQLEDLQEKDERVTLLGFGGDKPSRRL